MPRINAWLAFFWERTWPALVPLACVVAVFLSISWLGLWAYVPDLARQGSLVLFALAALVAASPLRKLELPSAKEIDRRLEVTNELHHRPVTAQVDSKARSANDGAESFGDVLWREHQRRMADKLLDLDAGIASPSVAKRDPWALRSLAVLALFVSAVTGYGNLSERTFHAFRSHDPIKVQGATGRIDAWLKPPAYTNKPPIFLSRAEQRQTDATGTIQGIPEGSILTIRVLGLTAPRVIVPGPEDDVELVASNEPGESDSNKSVFEANLMQSGKITLLEGEDSYRTWDIVVTPDHDPVIEFVEAPKITETGQIELLYKVEDDYGARSGHVEIEPQIALSESARPLVDVPHINLSMPSRRSKSKTAKTLKDLSDHPWAGLDVIMTLVAEDDAGQLGFSKPEKFTLPGRIFTKPLAKALVFERQRLALDANAQHAVSDMLDIITSTHPDIFLKDISHFTAIRVAYRQIKRAQDDDTLRDALDLLWQVALSVENGDLSLAQQRLRDAQERLAEALERGASDEEIERLMQELRQAMNEFLQEFARRMQQNPNQFAQQDQNAQVLRQQDLENMLQRMEDLSKSGSKDAARELLRQMQQMLNNLQMAQPRPGQQQQDPFSREMNRLSDMMREQQELMDQTFDMQRQQQGQQRQGQNDNQQQQNGQRQGEQQTQQPMTPEEFAEAMRRLQEQQGELQQQLEDMQQAMRDLGLEPGDRMEDAGRSMGEAEGNLGKQKTGEATQNQGEALDAMRDGAQQLMRNMQAQAGEQGRRNERGQHGQQTRQDADPLGRNKPSSGPQLGDDTKVPGEIDAQRAREILDAIRKRLGEFDRPKIELDYLDRLLPKR